jgi:aldehyde:ferredoxin oxidoreductase
MGSKNLKAIAIRGHRPITIARPEYFMKVCREALMRSQSIPIQEEAAKNMGRIPSSPA